MLSETIKALAEPLDKYRETGMTMEPEAVAVIVAALNEFARDAADLERSLRFRRTLDRVAPFEIPEASNVVRIR